MSLARSPVLPDISHFHYQRDPKLGPSFSSWLQNFRGVMMSFPDSYKHSTVDLIWNIVEEGLKTPSHSMATNYGINKDVKRMC
jgi:hypothetical protein